jgi:DNA-binding IclR family transcriptional regulator
MSAIDRYMDVLNLFTETKSTWTVQEVSLKLDVPLSTIYRTMRDLMRVSMLESALDGQYRLGPLFIEFDRRTRLTDPLVHSATPMLAEIAQHAQIPCVAVLARLYGRTVMCVADAVSPLGGVLTSYERGRPMPLARGATSKAILAQLSPRRLRKVFDADDASDHASLLNPEFCGELSAIRKNGYSIVRGEVDPGRAGVAVPLSIPEHGLVASLSLVVDAASLSEVIERRLVLLLVSSVGLLHEQLASHLLTSNKRGTDRGEGSCSDLNESLTETCASRSDAALEIDPT